LFDDPRATPFQWSVADADEIRSPHHEPGIHWIAGSRESGDNIDPSCLGMGDWEWRQSNR
jgi:hypothetical protein